MKILSLNLMHKKTKLYKWASALALITIFYNIFEGLVSVYFGLEDETIALFGFGLDSFVEVISGLGIWHMIMRIKFSSLPVIKWGMRGFDESPDRFEKQALKITGTAFYILTEGREAFQKAKGKACMCS